MMSQMPAQVNDILRQVGERIEEERLKFALPPPDKETSSAFSSLDFGQHSAARFLESPPPPQEFLLRGPGSLRAGIVGLLVADGGAGKTTLELQLAISVCSKIPFLDGLFQVETPPGRSVLLLAEDDACGVHHRFSQICDSLVAMDSRQDFIETIRDRLFVLSMTGADVRLTEPADGMVSESAAFEDLLCALKSLSDLRLVIIDPLARFYAGDENASADATYFISLAERISLETGATVLISHHTSKTSQNAALGVDCLSQGAARGSSGFADAARWQLAMARITVDEAKKLGIQAQDVHRYLVAKVVKSNYSALDSHFYLAKDANGCLHHVPLQESMTTQDEEVLSSIIDRLRTDSSQGKFSTKRAFARCHSKEWLEYGRRRLERILDMAIRDGLIETQVRPNRKGIETEFLAVKDEIDADIF